MAERIVDECMRRMHAAPGFDFGPDSAWSSICRSSAPTTVCTRSPSLVSHPGDEEGVMVAGVLTASDD
jgi:hypothetical protein